MRQPTEKEWIIFGLASQGRPGLKRVLSGQPRETVLRLPEPRDIFGADFPEWADNELARCRTAGVTMVTFGQVGYPPGLRNLPDPPPFLYVKGTLSELDRAAVAIVGSRRASLYGLRVAREFGRQAGQSGLTVVSGLARGVDTAAHEGALEAGGRTIGVLGCGVDVVYPRENRKLFDTIADAGALVTEFPFGTSPKPGHFPVRNRIIAGMSAAVVVVEAARDSGSLITAGLAASALGLPVGAVPGPITSKTSEGCNDLIYDGATPVRHMRDVLEMLPFRLEPLFSRAIPGGLGPLPQIEGDLGRVLAALSPEEERDAEGIAASVGLATGALLGHLLELELRGLAERRPSGRFIRRNQERP